MELTRWHALAASSFLEANAGLQYVFGDVSGSLHTRLGYSQRQLDGLGTAKVLRGCPPELRCFLGLLLIRAPRGRRSRVAQDCGTALVDVLAGFMFDAVGAPTTLVFIAVRAGLARGPLGASRSPAHRY